VADLFAAAPRELRASTDRPELCYERDPDLVAVHGGGSDTLPRAQRLDAQTLVVPAEAAPGPTVDGPTVDGATVDGTRLGPVYRRTEGGGLVVPTGAVLVRFAEGDPADGHLDELREVGYELLEVLSYAPHAGRVRALEGGIVEALRGLGRLEALPGIEHVEPQVLSERRPRPA
jgi:hypothetical protein